MVVSREVVLLKSYEFWAVYLIFDFLFFFNCRPVGFLCEWAAPGSEDTELGVFMGPEVSHGETKVYAGVQA